jgi:hypothetical protein
MLIQRKRRDAPATNNEPTAAGKCNTAGERGKTMYQHMQAPLDGSATAEPGTCSDAVLVVRQSPVAVPAGS